MHAGMRDTMHDASLDRIQLLIRKLPQWIRTDLSSHDASLRERAEDALYGMISAAIEAGGESSGPVT
jgi:hypothetical protein